MCQWFHLRSQTAIRPKDGRFLTTNFPAMALSGDNSVLKQAEIVHTIAPCGKHDADDSCALSRDILAFIDCQKALSVVVSWQRMISKIDFRLLSDRSWTFQEQHLSL